MQEHFAIKHVHSHAHLLQIVYSNTDARLYLRTWGQAHLAGKHVSALGKNKLL